MFTTGFNFMSTLYSIVIFEDLFIKFGKMTFSIVNIDTSNFDEKGKVLKMWFAGEYAQTTFPSLP